MEHENAKMREEQAKHLPVVFAQLNDDEKRLIDALYFRRIGYENMLVKSGCHIQGSQRTGLHFGEAEKIFFKILIFPVPAAVFLGGTVRGKINLTVPWQLNIKHQVQILCGELRRKAANCRAAPDKATTRIDDNDTPDQS